MTTNSKPNRQQKYKAGPTAWHWLANSYIEGAVALVERGPRRKGGAFRGWPAFYLMRHGLELALKSCLAWADGLGSSSEQEGMKKGHNLQELAETVERRAPRLISARLKALIAEVHELDPNGEDFKYPITGTQDSRAASMTMEELSRGWSLCERLLEVADEICDLPTRASRDLYKPETDD